MAQDTEQPEIDQQPVAADHINADTPHAPNLCVATNESLSDRDTSDPVREKLKKTSLASIPRTDTVILNSGFRAENGSPRDINRSTEQEAFSQTPSPTSESRGRLSRKRSYDDSIDPIGAATGIPSKNHRTEDDSKHARKRSRDVRGVQPQSAKSAAMPTEGSLLEREATSDEALDNQLYDRGMDDPIHSPRKKRSREDIDTDLQRGQKIAATDGAKAHRRSEDSERSQLHPQEDSNAVMTSSDVRHKQQARTSTVVIESREPAAQILSPQNPPSTAGVDEKESSKAPTSFAASGFAAMSGSSTSPFGAFGAHTASVFGSNPVTNPSATSAANTGINGLQKLKTSSTSAFGASASPFLGSSSTKTGVAFETSGTASKAVAFGGPVFGSGFSNSTAGAARLSSFAAPTSDVAIPSSTEYRMTFGTQADDSAEDDGGSEGDGNPEDTDAGDDEIDSRFEQQEGRAIHTFQALATADIHKSRPVKLVRNQSFCLREPNSTTMTVAVGRKREGEYSSSTYLIGKGREKRGSS